MTDRFTNDEAEGALLGAFLLSPELVAEARGLVHEGLFYREKNRVVWRAIEELGDNADIITIGHKIDQWGKGEDIDQAYLVTLASDSPVAEAWRHYADILQNLSGWRALQRTLQRALQGLGGDEPPDLAVERIREQLRESVEHRQDGGTIGSDVTAVLDRLDAYKEAAGVPGIPYGFPQLDEALGGQHPGQVVVIAGASGSGKSTLVVNLAERAASRGVAVIATNEMLGVDYAARLLSRRSHVNQDKFLTAKLTDAEWAAIGAAAGYVGDLPIYRLEAAFSADRLGLAVARARADTGKPVVWAAFDWIQAIDSGPHETQEIDRAMRAFKRVALEERIPVLVAAQFKKKDNGADLELEDVRGSKMITDMADNALFIQPWRDGPKKRGALAKIIRIHKARMGSSGEQPVWFDGAHAEFSPILPEDQQTELAGVSAKNGEVKRTTKAR